jgi:malate dehydrogenase (oxaloacetate-decarboxylating)(NADP+)
MAKTEMTRRERQDLVGYPTGLALLHDPTLNKGTAFTEKERDVLGLRGLLPPRVCSQEEQVLRVMENFRNNPDDLEKYIHMISLQDRNEALFYRVILDHIEEMLPIIYTPTVGRACQQYGHIFRRSRGMFVTARDRGRVRKVLENWPHRNVQVIVVTDGERILGLGDLGANGMGIPVGKLSLYTACAGIDPICCLPVTLDVGTNNESLLDDPLYLGTGQKRLRGQEYDDLVEEFVEAAQELFPNALLQFEDFANTNAFRLLDRYRDRICTFNDDIQGTAAVTLAGIYSAIRVTERRLADQTVLFMGAGAAGVGVADLIVSALMEDGLSEEEAKRRCWLFDSKALVVAERTDLSDQKRGYAHPHRPVATFLEAVEALRPTTIIGVSGKRGGFGREIVEAMANVNERPIVFSLSNPTSQTECTAEEAYKWSGGRAVFASGSPFPPVRYEGRIFVPGQGNNAYIFPGVGLGITAVRARRVTDAMFFAAARALAGLVSEADLDTGCIFPSLTRIREVSATIAVAVAEVAYEQGLAGHPRPNNIEKHIRSQMYEPIYVSTELRKRAAMA